MKNKYLVLQSCWIDETAIKYGSILQEYADNSYLINGGYKQCVVISPRMIHYYQCVGFLVLI